MEKLSQSPHVALTLIGVKLTEKTIFFPTQLCLCAKGDLGSICLGFSVKFIKP